MLNGYPRPQLKRNNWRNLNGVWDFVFDDDKEGEKEGWHNAFPKKNQKITVPYTYETKMSGIGEETFHPLVWYRKNLEIFPEAGKRILLHFEGVDYEAKVWVNGYYAGGHTGAYSRFTCDITDYVRNGSNEIVVSALDSQSCVQPRGKQRWKDENFGCWYVQTTGIWKTVWLEEVDQTYIESVKITPDIDRAVASFEMKIHRQVDEECSLICNISLGDRLVSRNMIDIRSDYAEFEISVADPDHPWEMKVWSPADPCLYSVNFELLTGFGVEADCSDAEKAVDKIFSNKDVDKVESYFAMRKISIEGDKILLNNLPLYQRLILDQGYWEESHLTPPSEEAIIKDIDLIMAAGYNGLRKHQKVEDERFLYWCDVKGLLVWCEMPSQYIFNDEGMQRFTGEWIEIVRQNYNHPCVITWTAFNESWGIERIYSNVNQQKFTEGIYSLTKAYDPMRPVIVNDGWEHTCSDILTLHDYEEKGEAFAERYKDKDLIVNNKLPFNRDRYATALGYSYKGQPVIMSEYGGIAFSGGEGWGYGGQVKTQEEFINRFKSITEAIRDLDYNAGFCYTQVTDVQQEINGLYTIDRKAKVDIDKIRKINLGE
ncbi:glycoside hydrolase family 2 protein [Butyrivibrio sp. MC2013]|uniref:glycoside hydrolase family 2 protein n=1 Tax=Butyrivibrio sp. MC2013 TaxID=1280686 RepID=UPI000423F4EF|nr:sugar-binding domain-containing protein [Butyrivibrio sp. MC2013]